MIILTVVLVDAGIAGWRLPRRIASYTLIVGVLACAAVAVVLTRYDPSAHGKVAVFAFTVLAVTGGAGLVAGTVGLYASKRRS